MSANLPHALQRNQYDSGVQIRVQGPESERSASNYSDNSAATSITSSNFIEIILTVQHQSRKCHSQVAIDVSDDESYDIVCDELERLRPSDHSAKDQKLERYYILSGNFQSEVKSSIRVSSHLEKAVALYQSGSFTRFEICETISSKLPKNNTTVLQALQDCLSNSKIQCDPDGKGDFIPASTLREIMSKEKLRALFHEDKDLSELPDFEEVLEEICVDCYKLLATILLADIKPVGKMLLGFKNASMLDGDMPFKRKLRFPLEFVTTCEYNNIFNNQWSTIAFVLKPYDKTTKKDRILDKEMVMPFVEMEQLHCGGFGEVFKVKVHPAHQNLSKVDENRDSYFALKKLRRNNNNKSPGDFTRELQALIQISARESLHLMRLLTAFQQGEDFYLVFPLAECSLEDCFEKEDHVGDAEYFIWACGQAAGLADGIHVIHGDANSHALSIPSQGEEILGYHHDLKPDNILLVKLREEMNINGAEMIHGRLQISDFGLGRFREAATGSKSYNIKGTLTYSAPESHSKHEQARPYDIWSFGCILLEILIWLLAGKQGRKEFNSSRETYLKSTELNSRTDCYWVQSESGYILNEAVQDRMEDTRNQTVFPGWSHNIRVLVDIVRDCLQIDPGRRPKAARLVYLMKIAAEQLQRTPPKK